MATKITVMYNNPQDPEALEARYPDQLVLAKIPGVVKIETSKVWPKEDGSPTPAYRFIDLYFSDYDAASGAGLRSADDQRRIHRTEGSSERHRVCRVLGRGWVVAAPPSLRTVRACRLLRFVPVPTRQQARGVQ